MAAVLEAARRVLMQKETLLAGMERLGLDRAYAAPCSVVGGSIGAHTRHALDHYTCLVDALVEARGKPGAAPVVRYDARLRGTDVESDLSAGLEAVLDCSIKMAQIDPEWLASPVKVEFCLDGAGQHKKEFESSGERELWFVAHHAIHHQAMMRVIATNCDQAQECSMALPKGLGVAPATQVFRDGGEGKM